jgi:hypothetical protein
MYLIVWDLDGTLGDFSALLNRGNSTEPVTLRVRPGLADTLRELADAGFAHTLLTLATSRYAELALAGAGLRPFFSRVEGVGQRDKGDAAGLGSAMGLSEEDRPHRMLFVGDHPHYDEPRDRRVVFHLEFCTLSRPARELQNLILNLRDGGNGSIRGGFDRLLRQVPWWRQLLRRPRPGTPLPRSVPGVGDVVLFDRANGCPVVGFRDPPGVSAKASEHRFVPADF